jgi:hypothetical protein
VQATLMSRQTAGDQKQIDVWAKATKVQAMLATKLRLTPSSRIDPKTLARMQPKRHHQPWESK